MNIPEKIKIGWKEYEVVEKEYNDDLVNGGGECYGQTHYVDMIIYLNSRIKGEQKEATFIHEIIHGIDEMWGIGLKEEQVEALGHGIYTVIKDNSQHDEVVMKNNM